MNPKYEFFEIVKVSKEFEDAKLANLEGAVLGRAEGDDVWYYYVHLYTSDELRGFREEDLNPTGKMDKWENFYTGESIRVIVDPDTGEGRIADS